MTTRYTFRSEADHQNITEIATSELEAFALMAFTAERRHDLDPADFDLIAEEPLRYSRPV